MRIALDIDNNITAFPDYFILFTRAMQEAGHEVGILTARLSNEKDQIAQGLHDMGIVPNFIITKPDEYDGKVSNGIFKGVVCNEMDINVLYDDFECSDPKMLADFFSVNTKTIPFTGFGYKE